MIKNNIYVIICKLGLIVVYLIKGGIVFDMFLIIVLIVYSFLDYMV